MNCVLADLWLDSARSNDTPFHINRSCCCISSSMTPLGTLHHKIRIQLKHICRGVPELTRCGTPSAVHCETASPNWVKQSKRQDRTATLSAGFLNGGFSRTNRPPSPWNEGTWEKSLVAATDSYLALDDAVTGREQRSDISDVQPICSHSQLQFGIGTLSREIAWTSAYPRAIANGAEESIYAL